MKVAEIASAEASQRAEGIKLLAPVRRSVAAALAVASGGLFALSLPPTDLWPLAWLGFMPLLLALRGRGVKGGLLVGGLAGFTTCVIAMAWMPVLLGQFAHLPPWVSYLVWIAAAIVHGAPFFVAGALTCWFWRRGLRPMWIMPCCFVAGELLFQPAFPWQLGLSQHSVLVLIQVADIFGSRVISALVAIGGTALFEVLFSLWDPKTRRAATISAAIILAAVVYGVVRLPMVRAARQEAPELVIGLVQANISVEDKHNRTLTKVNLALHQDLSREAEDGGAQIVVWPESAYPHYIDRSQRRDLPGAKAIRRGFSVPVIFGANSVNTAARQRFNSAFLLTEHGALLPPADKNELLIFGEYIPLYEDFELLQQAFPTNWSFTPGERPTVLRHGELRAGILNCYEDILPTLVRELVQEQPNLLVNVTNDAWFGRTGAPHQHAALARFRAVEHRVDLARAVNTGVSTVVTATGEELAHTDVFERATVVERVRLMEAGSVYTTMGDSWAWCVVLVLLVLGGLRWHRGKRQQSAKPFEEGTATKE